MYMIVYTNTEYGKQSCTCDDKEEAVDWFDTLSASRFISGVTVLRKGSDGFYSVMMTAGDPQHLTMAELAKLP